MSLKLLFSLFGLIVTSQAKTFENYKVYSVIPHTEQQVQFLNEIHKLGYDTWNAGFQIGTNVKIMVAPEKNEEFVKYTSSVGKNATLSISNVQKLIDAQMLPAKATERSSMGSYSWTAYHTLDQIYAWLDELQEQYPNIVQTITIGTTIEGRPIKGIIIDFKSGTRQGTPPIFGMLEGALHAREWISPATVTWIVKEFLTSTDPEVRLLAESIVWHIFPVLNPDGYVYSFTNNRMWRKNRNPANFVSCSASGVDDDLSNGIDLNRNFDYLWMTIGGSANPCDTTYAGPVPASELETQAITSHVHKLQSEGNLMYYLAFHSYSQMVLIPYSHVTGAGVLECDNYADLYEITARGVDKLMEVHGTPYTYGVSAEILYPVAGSAFDWVKGVANVPIVLLFELRDRGETGFLLPTDQIIPNNEETMAFIIEMDKGVRSLGYYYHSSKATKEKAGVLAFLVSVCLLLIAK